MKKDKPKTDNTNRKPSKKFVKKANQWCKTSWSNGKQLIEWFDKEPKLESYPHIS